MGCVMMRVEVTMIQVESINVIGTNPDIRGGRPYILGTTITVADVAIAKVFHGRNADEIAEDYHLGLDQVYAALSYYYKNKTAIDASIEERHQLALRMKEQRLGSRHSPLFR